MQEKSSLPLYLRYACVATGGHRAGMFYNAALLCALVAFLVVSTTVYAQGVAGLGAVSGTVRDSTGAIVPGANVILTNESRGITRTTQTTDAGVFTIAALQPSAGYTLTVDKSGFAKWEAKSFTVQVGQTVDFSNVTLAVGTTATQVDVTAEAPL